VTEPTDDEDVKVQAWKLATVEKLPQREIARRLGISQPSVSRYVAEGRDAETWVAAFAKKELRQDMAYQLWELVKRWIARMDTADDLKMELAISEHIAKLWAQIATLLGLNEPTRVAVGRDDGGPKTPDPRFVAEIERASRDSTHYLDRIRQGLPGREESA
jgi:phosphoglycolate phosphatase-like HAD superfamily hydrolase